MCYNTHMHTHAHTRTHKRTHARMHSSTQLTKNYTQTISNWNINSWCQQTKLHTNLKKTYRGSSGGSGRGTEVTAQRRESRTITNIYRHVYSCTVYTRTISKTGACCCLNSQSLVYIMLKTIHHYVYSR